MNQRGAIFILGGGLVKENSRWRTTNFDEGDTYGAIGDRLRVEAAYILYQKNPNLLLIPSCGKGQYKDIPNVPTVAEVVKQELIELGIPESSIIKEERSGNTWQQLQELKNIIEAKKFVKVYILSNRHHLPRVRAMIEVDNDLNKMLREKRIELVSTEEVLIGDDAGKWKKYIDEAYQSEVIKKRIKMEKQGVEQIKNGTYRLS